MSRRSGNAIGGRREGGNRESAGSALSTISPFLIQPICLPTTSPPLISQSHTFAVSTVSEGARDGGSKGQSTNPTLFVTYHIQCVVNVHLGADIFACEGSRRIKNLIDPYIIQKKYRICAFSQIYLSFSALEPFLISYEFCFSHITIQMAW